MLAVVIFRLLGSLALHSTPASSNDPLIRCSPLSTRTRRVGLGGGRPPLQCTTRKGHPLKLSICPSGVRARACGHRPAGVPGRPGPVVVAIIPGAPDPDSCRRPTQHCPLSVRQMLADRILLFRLMVVVAGTLQSHHQELWLCHRNCMVCSPDVGAPAREWPLAIIPVGSDSDSDGQE